MDSHRSSLVAAMSVFLVLDTVAIAARVYVRTLMISNFGWDDATLCLAYVGYLIACAMGFVSMYYGYAADKAVHNTHWDSHKAQRFYYANQLSLYLSTGVVKIAVALVLWRLAVNARLRIILITAMVVVVIWTFVMTLFSSWLCATNGVSNYVGSATCTAVGYFRMTSNICIDYFFALFPIFMLRNAKMSFRMKLSVCILLGLGMFASAATIAKLVILVELQHARKSDTDALHQQLLIWADIELGLAIFCASSAALRPLLRKSSSIWSPKYKKNSGNPCEGSNDASFSCQPLSRDQPDQSAANGPGGIEEYELSKMDSQKLEDIQKPPS